MEESLYCLQCGKCCFVDLSAYAEQEDFDRWRAENRQDILNIIEHRHLIWAGDRMISSETGDYPHGMSLCCIVRVMYSLSRYMEHGGRFPL